MHLLGLTERVHPDGLLSLSRSHADADKYGSLNNHQSYSLGFLIMIRLYKGAQKSPILIMKAPTVSPCKALYRYTPFCVA